MSFDLDFDLDFEPSRKQPPTWPGPVALLGLGLIIVLVITCSSCSSQFYYPDGALKASIMGDLTYSKSAKGDETFSLKHSPVIRAGGIAATQGIAAAGSAASAALLAR